jgi:hypothetical protein
VQRVRRRWLVAGALAAALWPRLVPLDDLPRTHLAQRYKAEAENTLAWARGHPVQRLFDSVIVQQWRFSNWREVPGSGEGSPAIAEAQDILVTVTALGPWGIPVARYTICCGASGYRIGG